MSEYTRFYLFFAISGEQQLKVLKELKKETKKCTFLLESFVHIPLSTLMPYDLNKYGEVQLSATKMTTGEDKR